MIERTNDNRIDSLEVELINGFPMINCPLVHRFTDGLYIREIFMPAETLVTSKIHLTIHPFTISKGRVAVSVDGKDWEILKAPYTGITQPGTRRVLYVQEDCIWTTYHPLEFITGEENKLDEKNLNVILEKIENTILEPHINCITGTDINKEYKELLNNKTLDI